MMKLTLRPWCGIERNTDLWGKKVYTFYVAFKTVEDLFSVSVQWQLMIQSLNPAETHRVGPFIDMFVY